MKNNENIFIYPLSHQNEEGNNERIQRSKEIFLEKLEEIKKDNVDKNVFYFVGANGELFRSYNDIAYIQNIGDKEKEQSTLSELLNILQYIKSQNIEKNSIVYLVTNGQEKDSTLFSKLFKGGHSTRVELLIKKILSDSKYDEYKEILSKIEIIKIEQQDWTKIDQTKEIIMLTLMILGLDDYFAKFIRKILGDKKTEQE